MKYYLHPPFGRGRTDGRKSFDEIDIQESISINELLELISSKHPELNEFIRETLDETFYQLLVFRSDQALTKEDRIEPDDCVELMMPLHGG